jgi:hypothetical protein
MGFKEMRARAKEAAKNKPIATYGGFTDPIELRKDTIKRVIGTASEAGEHSLHGVTARVEEATALESRVTMTRLVAFGVLAFAAKKKTGGQSFLTIEGPDFLWAIEVDRKAKLDATKFANAINAQVKVFDASEAQRVDAPTADQSQQN